jgi:hypothetical protein
MTSRLECIDQHELTDLMEAVEAALRRPRRACWVRCPGQPGTASPTPAVQCGQVVVPAQQRSISTIPEGRSTPRIERNIAASFPWDQRRQPAGIGARAGNGVGRHGTS